MNDAENQRESLSRDRPAVLSLRRLARGMLGISPSFGQSMVEAASVCLQQQGHRPGVGVRQKVEQTRASDHVLDTLPAFVVVVEFSRPLSEVVRR